ncbi:hypothetical protein JAAARDRAFT_206519 [Jaapia argillacea MUCL 33604]|uniref:ELYS-like domain-containing protein n=1 Tax=Jaapia argillacea MUCL 33604 TaxID=933084 RepID=A0A067PUZ7_9AGAM|nr:hypothetical protein JAAARDRAFT_206519 [Jaapia argillacea MUCL 33604]
MDIDGETETEYLNVDLVTLFDTSPDGFPWRGQKHQEIETRRAQMSDLLLFDMLLSSGSVPRPDALYPPTDITTLRRLLDAIEESTYDALKKDCLIYFLLKWHGDGREVSFAEDRCIPPQFTVLADAYWYLDAGVDLEKAVALLSDRRVTRDFPSKILEALSLSEDPYPLVRRYVRTARPLLTQPNDMDLYIIALAESSLLEAWQWQRTFPENSDTRARLIQKILDWALAPDPRPQPLTQLMSFPFTNYEQSLIQSYALNPPSTLPPTSIPIIQELVCTRLIQSGQYAAAIKLDRQFSSSLSASSDSNAKKVAEERRVMLDEILSILPAIERQMIEEEMEEITKGKGKEKLMGDSSKSKVPPLTSSAPNDLSMSWEEVRLPPRDGKVYRDAPVPPISERAGAPRFGAVLPSSHTQTQTRPPIVPVSQAPPTIFSQAQGQPSTTRPFVAPPVLPTSFNLGAERRPKPPTSSLFDSTGSANLARNAFYNPPAAKQAQTNGNLGLFSAVTTSAPSSSAPALPVSAPPPPAVVDDVNMESEDEFVVTGRRSRPSAHVNGDEETQLIAPEFSFSVFGSSGGSGPGPSTTTAPPPRKSPRRAAPARSETLTKMPPGAFVSHDEDVSEHEKAPVRNGRGGYKRPSPSPPEPATNKRRSTRKSPVAPAGASKKDKDLGRSLPGTLVAEVDEDHEHEGEHEEEDAVAPLRHSPPSKKAATRKSGRTSRGSSVDADDIGGTTRVTRRSARLSVEPPSPQAQTHKTEKRTSTRATGASKSGARRKR